MARYGMNPARKQTSGYVPSRVTAAVVTYIPSLEGYFSHRLEVLKLSLSSLLATMDPSSDIMILNNGSCQQVSRYLEGLLRDGRIDYLIHSRQNLGVIGAFKILFRAAPGDIIAYSDDDVFFYPGWLKAQLEILDNYPSVGMVSGAPVGYSSEHAFRSVDRFLQESSHTLTVGSQQRNKKWEEDWASSTGRSIPDHLESISSQPYQLVDYQGVRAIKAAKHFQFITPKKVIGQALAGPWDGSLMDGLVELDETVDELGYLRLSTPERYTRHIGNLVTEEIAREAEALKIGSQELVSKIVEDQHWLLSIPGSGRILWPLYRWLFRVLHGVK